MAWKSLRERGGRKASDWRERLCEAKEIIEDVCSEIEDMDEELQERDDYDRYPERERYSERRGRDGMGRYTRR